MMANGEQFGLGNGKILKWKEELGREWNRRKEWGREGWRIIEF